MRHISCVYEAIGRTIGDMKEYLKSWCALLIFAPVYLATGNLHAATMDVQTSQLASQIASETPWVQSRVQPRTQSRNSKRHGHPLGVQTLSVEKAESKSQTSATTKVYQFHYDLNSARVLTIDPQLGSVVNTQTIDSVHLPLNEVEIAYASQLLGSQTAMLETLREEQRRRGQVAFSQISELELKASIFEPHDTQQICSRQRCALLSLFDDTRTVFSVEPVINLQSLKVETLRPR